MQFEILDLEKLDQDVEYRKDMLNYLFQELDQLRKFHDQLSQNGNLIGEIVLKKISEIEKNLQVLGDEVYINSI